MRYLSLCSGIEAATVAWHPMGWEPAAFAEIEAFPAAVLKHHYPNTPNLGDMTKWREWNVGSIDLLVGGTPCQSFSVAGLRKGLSDPRGGLMLTFLEIAQSLRPRWVVWENVPGVLSSAGGRDFGSFLGALGELGYGWAYRVLDAQWCRVDGYERAVPQRRRRVFVVGCLGDATRAAKVLFERQSVERNPAPRRAKGQGAAADATECAPTVCSKWSKQSGGPAGSECGNLTVSSREWPAEVCSTLNASFGEKQGLEDQHALGGAQCFVPAVAGTIDCDIPKQRVQNMAAGHWLAVPIQDGREITKAQNGLGVGTEGDPAYTLDQTGAQAVAIQGNLIGRDVGGPQGVGASTDGAMYTLTKADIHAVAVPFRKSHRAASATDDESWVRAETANTLNRFDTGERDTHAIAFTPGNLTRGAGPSPNSEVAPTQRCSAGRGADDQRTCVAFTCKDHGADAGDVAPTLHAIAFKPGQSAQARSLGAQDEVACTLEAGGGGNNRQAVAIDLYNQEITGDAHCPLRTAGGHGAPAVMQPSAIAFNWQNGGGYGNANEGLGITIEGTGPLQRCNTPAVAFKPSHPTRGKDGSPADITPPLSADADKGDQDTVVVAPSLTASNDPSRSPQSAEVTQQIAAVHQATMVVRRLTPVECERLQGFPDDYTNIPWRGKPESPDGPRYKALGNSMAVNCMRWIGRRIDAVEKGMELPA